ncbi:cytosolic sulfotransferase 1-like [Salmo salar]|uniref:Sulfotransferase n=1 Tax=Salmo salar TaxID=8030 RepID=A0ABM3CZQ1_SALSA|nr:cytosolic sulfotransferase 1-like [Salmo salar]
MTLLPDPVISTWLFSSVVFGPWSNHVTGWWEKKQTHSKLLYLFYEAMVEVNQITTSCAIKMLLELEYSIQCVCVCFFRTQMEEKERVRGRVQFENMKKNSFVNYSTSLAMDFKISLFMRKGKVGDWKNHFTVAQSEQFDEDYKKKMKNITVQFHTVV